MGTPESRRCEHSISVISGCGSRCRRRRCCLSYHFHARRQRALDLLPERLGRVADVGCGVMIEAVLSRGGTFDGVDLSPEMIREAREKFGHLSKVSFREGDVDALALPDEAYDQAICMAVIEYLSNPRRAMSEIARIILKPGGIAIVTVSKTRSALPSFFAHGYIGRYRKPER